MYTGKYGTLTQITLPTHIIHNCIVNFKLTNNYGELSFNDFILKQTVVIPSHYIMYKLVHFKICKLSV